MGCDAKDLDAAVAHAKDFLFDYGDLTPMLQGLKQFFRSSPGPGVSSVAPWTWALSLHELADIGRFVDTVFEPHSRGTVAMDPWRRSQGPTMGALRCSSEPMRGYPLSST